MRASIVDLRYHMKDVLKAIARNQTVTIMYHGKEKATMIPTKSQHVSVKVEDTKLFGMNRNDQHSVENVMNELRGGRYHDI